MMMTIERPPTSDVLRRKLEHFTNLTDSDRLRLRKVTQPVHSVAAHVDLIREGDSPSDIFLIVEGFACRYKLTQEGNRQIMAYLIPGDFCDLHVFVLKAMDHSIATLSPCKVVRIPVADVSSMLESPSLARGLMCCSLVDSATLREWLVNIGQRSGEERVAHLFCELLLRMRAVGLTPSGDGYSLPITQRELADTMGMTDVHMNRVIQALRNQNLISLKAREIVIPDVGRLNAFAGFDPNYLHLAGTKRPSSIGT